MLEPDAALTALVRARLPLPRGAPHPDPAGRRAARASPRWRDASADVVVLDAFHGGRVPAELTTREFVAEVARVLRPDGVLLANVADGPPLTLHRAACWPRSATVLPDAAAHRPTRRC